MRLRKYITRILFELYYKYVIYCITKYLKGLAYPYIFIISDSRRMLYRKFLISPKDMLDEVTNIIDKSITGPIKNNKTEIELYIEAEYGKSIDKIMEEEDENFNKRGNM